MDSEDGRVRKTVVYSGNVINSGILPNCAEHDQGENTIIAVRSLRSGTGRDGDAPSESCLLEEIDNFFVWPSRLDLAPRTPTCRIRCGGGGGCGSCAVPPTLVLYRRV